MLTSGVKHWLATTAAVTAGHAAFISACYFHCGSSATWGVVHANGNGLTGAEAFGQWMVDPKNTKTTHLWNIVDTWNYTSGCGGNVPGPEKRGL
jgi:hypothetical protein